MRVRGTARNASASAGLELRAGVCVAIAGQFCACALPIPEEGPLGVTSVRFNTCHS